MFINSEALTRFFMVVAAVALEKYIFKTKGDFKRNLISSFRLLRLVNWSIKNRHRVFVEKLKFIT